jgi:hypothetical protein
MLVNSPNRLTALALGAFGIVSVALATWAVTQEGAAYTLSGGTALKSVAALSDADPVALGIGTRGELLQHCRTALRSEKSLELKFIQGVSFADLVARCREVGEEIVASSPSFSFAWAVAADAARHQQDWPAMNQYLLASQKSGPNEQWIARYRFEIADEMLQWVDQEVRGSYTEDLRLLISSNKSTSYMARQYVLNPAFRDRLASVLAGMGEPEQRRFLGSLRRMLPRDLE